MAAAIAPPRAHRPHQMALPMPPMDGVAAHLAEGFDVVGEQQGLRTHRAPPPCSLGAGMAAADNDHVESGGMEHGKPGMVLIREPDD